MICSRKLFDPAYWQKEDAEIGSNKDVQLDNHHHHYLKHRASTNNGDHMKCVVFYTSLVHKGKSCNLRELKSLPGNSVGKVDVHADDIACNKGNRHISKTKHRKGKLDDISPSRTKTAKIYSKKNSSNADFQKAKHNRNATGQKEVNANPDDANKTMEYHENQKTYVPHGNQPKRINSVKEKHQVIQLSQFLPSNDKDSLFSHLEFHKMPTRKLVPLKFEDGEMMAMAEKDE
ncbi:hypothetical protein JHK84_043119 [Glycine max]|nr:hypothetical protein JHK84_043119 [Glycine max]